MIPAAYPGESGASRAVTALTHALPWVLVGCLAMRSLRTGMQLDEPNGYARTMSLK